MINWKAALALVAVFLALGVYAFQSRPGTTPAKPAAELLPCDVVQTLDLKVTGSGGKVVELRRSAAGDSWQLLQPSTGPADGTVVDDLLATAVQLQSTDTLKTPPAEPDLGLDPARLTVACTLAKGGSYTLSIGGQNFDSSGDYARLSGDARVYVIPSATVAKFQQALDQPPVRPSPSPSGSPSPNPSPSP
ncbi:MAG TPA: DUF4340 domain-containing protein [Candidatus Dormibacteraeota bacterium]